MKALVIVRLVLVISESVSSQLVSQTETALNESCRTSEVIKCNGEVVKIKVGTCLTRLSKNSDIAVRGKCPYITSSKLDEVLLHANFYHIKLDISTLTEQTCAPLNRKGLSAMMDMAQQCTPLVTSVSNVTGIPTPVGHFICLWCSSPSLCFTSLSSYSTFMLQHLL